MRTVDESIEDKRVSHIENALRRRQIREVKLYMKKVFNPMYYNTKPRYRKPLTPNEQVFVKDALKNIYNPKIYSKNKLFRELGIRNLAET